MSANWPLTGGNIVGTAGALTRLDVPAINNKYLQGILALVGYDADPPAGSVFTVKTGDSFNKTLLTLPMTAGGPAPIPLDGYISDYGKPLRLELSAGGGSIKGYINVSLKKT